MTDRQYPWLDVTGMKVKHKRKLGAVSCGEYQVDATYAVQMPSNAENTNFSSYSYFAVGEENGKDNYFKTTWITFSMASLPWKRVRAAYLYAYVYYNQAVNGCQVDAHVCKRNVIYNQVTYQKYNSGGYWTTDGGQHMGNDVYPDVQGSWTIAAAAAPGWYSMQLDPKCIENWKYGNVANYGFILRAPWALNNNHRYYNHLGTYKPHLKVYYVEEGE